jgi:thiamine transport system permease protein
VKFFKSSTLSSVVPSYILLALALNGFCFLIFQFTTQDFLNHLSTNILIKTILFTLFQAALSSAVSVLIGLAAAPGYVQVSRRGQKFLRWILLTPNLMSSILVVLCMLLTFKNFPFGLRGIILAHVFLNAGLCTVWLGESYQQVLHEYSKVLEVVGAGEYLRFRKIYLPLILPQIKSTFSVVFALCLSSFAIPLILGGGPQYSTLEVLIYEVIHTNANISWSMIIGAIQGLIQILVFTFLITSTQADYSQKFSPKEVRPSFGLLGFLGVLGLIFVLLLTLMPILSFFKSLFSSVNISEFLALLQNVEFVSAFENSIFVALGIFAFTFAMLTWFSAVGWSKFIAHIPTLSGVVIGLAGILLFHLGAMTSISVFFIALIWGHLAVILPSVVRLSLPSIRLVRSHFSPVVEQLGASSYLAFKRIYFSFNLKTILAASGLAACWSLGDFGVARIFGSSHKTLPIFIQDLMGSYRLEVASIASVFLILATLVALFAMESL